MEPPRLHDRSLQCHPTATSNSAIPINRAVATSCASDRHKGAPSAKRREDHDDDRNSGAPERPAQTSSATHTRRPMAAETGKIQTVRTRSMQAFRAIPVLALAAALGLGMTANAALAPQMSSSSDHSSNMGQSVSDGLVTTRVKSERATTKASKAWMRQRESRTAW